jgi:hypothetical protein
VTSSSRPGYLPAEGEGTLVVMVENFGDASAGGAGSPVSIADVLPEGLQPAGGASAFVGSKPTSPSTSVPLNCNPSTLTCTLEESLGPYQQLEVRIRVRVLEGAHTGEVNRVLVSGGGAPSASLSRPITVSEAETPFGVEDFELRAEEEGGRLATQAGSHPFQVTGTFVFNQGSEERDNTGKAIVFPAGLPKDINTLLPPGLIGNPTPFATCTAAEFDALSSGRLNPEENRCPQATAVGVAAVTVEERFAGYVTITVPVFNLEPAFGEPARFGFAIPIAGTTIILDSSLRSGPGEDYGITVSSLNTTQQAGTLEAQVTFWGVPGDPRHNSSRGWSCLDESAGYTHGPCERPEEFKPPAFLTMPTACDGELRARADVNEWNDAAHHLTVPPSEPLQSLDGCNRLPFGPEFSAEPSSEKASSPTGLNVNLDFHDEGLTSAEGLAQSQMQDNTVVLPEGLTVNPSSGVGLGGCTEADYAAETISSTPGAGCPNNSKLGTVEVTTPLLPTPIHGSLYIAQPYENPSGSLIALYVVLKNQEKGILIKLAGKVTPDPVTGRLTTTFQNTPPLSFSHFNFHFREGAQAPLITPATCGVYTAESRMVPFSEPASVFAALSSFQITEGSEGAPCPSGSPPFTPHIQAGTLNNNAGGYSPFYLHLTRTDADSEISSFSTTMPPGFTGVLTGIPYCPEQDIQAARAKTGVQEEQSPSCPAASRLGHSLVGTGVGSVLAYTPGEVYLAGPYNGDPFSLVSVTSAVVGPFDLGTVVIRFGLKIDEHTAQVIVDPSASEPIPTIIKGIVTHVRDIRVYVDRPNFTLNPTSCNPMTVNSTLASNLGQSATIASPFQASNCANLKFAPTAAVATGAKASKANGASLSFKIAYPKGALGTQSWFNEAKFTVPKQLPAELKTIQHACDSKTFEGDRAACPAASKIGTVTVHTPVLPVPLTGPVYFVSYGGAKFPEAVLVLDGDGVHIELHGETLIAKGITSATFRNTPDVPFESIEVNLPTGPFSEFGANLPHHSYDFCGQKLAMPTFFKAQNGLQVSRNTSVTITGCPKHKTNTQKLAAALKTCHKKHGSKRTNCEKAARKA